MPRISHREPTERQREWLGHLRSCREQGLSLKAYAEQSGLEVQRFYHWHRRLKLLGLAGGSEEVSFTAVRVQRSQPLGKMRRLRFPNGMVLEWEGATDLVLIEQLLRVSQLER